MGADSLIVSKTHTELVLPDETRTVRQLSECSGAECQLFDPVTGETDTASLDTAVVGLGDAEAIGSGSAPGWTTSGFTTSGTASLRGLWHWGKTLR